MKNLLKKIAHWEAWPFKILYAPISLVWLWYIIKSRAVWFFTPSNPGLTFGGLEGEPKKEMYALLPNKFYPKTFNTQPKIPFENIEKIIAEKQMQFPLVSKPEVGWQGVLMRKHYNIVSLKNYHSKMPWEYIIQEWVHYPMEVSVFYIRHPKETKGKVTGFLHKIHLHVIGDGLKTLQQLVANHPKAFKKIDEHEAKHQEKWNTVIAKDEKYFLSYAANHNRGARFVDLKNEIDEKLVAVFDRISNPINDFFYGRYDIMCSNVEDLKNENNFTILEYNGCGAEPNHFYDTGYTLIGAYKEILLHWKALYNISRYNAEQGIKPWPLFKGMRYLKNVKKLNKEMFELDRTIDN